MPDTSSPGPLDQLGWQVYAAAGLVTDQPVSWSDIGRVRRVDRGEVDVATAAGDVRALSDSQRAQSDVAPATGDWVRLGDGAGLGTVVEAVLPRYSAIVRRDPAEEVVEQVLVANVDVVGVVAGVDRPLNVAKLERFLVLAADSGARPVIVMTKIDLGVSDEWAGLPDAVPDVPVLATSARTGEGVAAVEELVDGDLTLVLLGESGSGKSSLVNAMMGSEVQETSEVRARDAKGRHTTTARELVVMPRGGVLIDTPGVRGVGLWDAEPALERVFADITALAHECRFNDCSHRVEPGCGVQTAVEDGRIDPVRLERYLRLRAELVELADRREDRRRKQRGRPQAR